MNFNQYLQNHNLNQEIKKKQTKSSTVAFESKSKQESTNQLNLKAQQDILEFASYFLDNGKPVKSEASVGNSLNDQEIQKLFVPPKTDQELSQQKQIVLLYQRINSMTDQINQAKRECKENFDKKQASQMKLSKITEEKHEIEQNIEKITTQSDWLAQYVGFEEDKYKKLKKLMDIQGEEMEKASKTMAKEQKSQI